MSMLRLTSIVTASAPEITVKINFYYQTGAFIFSEFLMRVILHQTFQRNIFTN